MAVVLKTTGLTAQGFESSRFRSRKVRVAPRRKRGLVRPTPDGGPRPKGRPFAGIWHIERSPSGLWRRFAKALGESLAGSTPALSAVIIAESATVVWRCFCKAQAKGSIPLLGSVRKPALTATGLGDSGQPTHI